MNLKLFIFSVGEYLRSRKEFLKGESESVLGSSYEQEHVF